MTRAAAPLLGLAVLVRCTFDPSLDSTVRLDCGGPRDCPTGTRCSLALGACVPLSSDDVIAPTLEATLVTPTAGNRVATFVFQVRVSETLGRAPVLHLVDSGGRELTNAVARDAGLSRESAWSWKVLDDPLAGEGLAHAVVDLVDPAGNASERLEVGSFDIDFTPPALEPGSEQVTLVPRADNPLGAVEALGEGTVAVITFVTTEPIEGLTLLADAGLLMHGPETAGTFNRFFASLPDGGPQVEADVVLQARGTDRAGNLLDVSLATLLRVDTRPPGAPDETRGELVYVRAPEGTTLSSTPRFTAEAEPGVIEPRAWVIVRELGGVELGRGRADALGVLAPIPLGQIDRGQVDFALVDSAGNALGPLMPRRSRWVTHLASGVAHRVELRPLQTAGARQPNATTWYAPFPTAPAVGSRPAWKLRAPRAAPPCAQLAADARHGRVSAFSAPDTLWEWDGEQWSTLPGAPLGCQADAGVALAWDERREVLVLACSASGLPVLWERINTQWTAAGSAPPVRELVWWPPRGQVLAVDAQSGALSTWSGTAWLPLGPGLAGMRAVAREGAADALLGIDALGATWRWQSPDAGWRALDAGAGSGAGADSWRLTSTAVDDGVWLVRPNPDGGPGLRGLTWSGSTWQAPIDLPLGPAAAASRCAFSAAAEPFSDRVLVVAEPGATGVLSTAGSAVLIASDGGVARLPSTFLGPAAAFSARAGRTFFQLGRVGLGVPNLRSWDGTQWRTEPSVAARMFSTLVEESSTGRLVSVGGQHPNLVGAFAAPQVFEDGGWRPLSPLPPRSSMAVADCPALGGVVAHGGVSDAGTCFDRSTGTSEAFWLPSGSDVFQPLGDTGGDGRAFHFLVPHPTAGRCQLGLGYGAPLTVWWTPPAGSASWSTAGVYRFAPVAAAVWFDPAARRVFAFGGFDDQALRDLYQANDALTDFVALGSTDPEADGDPGARAQPVGAFDSRRGRYVMLGGRTSSAETQDLEELWELRHSGERPAVAIFLQLGSLPAGARVTRVWISASPTASGALPDGGLTPGARLDAFAAGRWVKVSTVGAAASLIDSPALVDAMVRGQTELGVALLPEGARGHDAAAIEVGSFEARLEYVLP